MVKKKAKVFYFSISLLFSLSYSFCYAIDNPDSPNLIQQFKNKTKNFIKKIDNPNNTNRDIIIAYHQYHRFLDNELNSVYQFLQKNLPVKHKQALKKSQFKWLKYRDTEFNFIKNNWNRTNFGSSAILSRGAYQAKIIENRVIQLLQYSLNY